jgi:acetyl/propionyl-CoA carboxylase alpha subunit
VQGRRVAFIGPTTDAIDLFGDKLRPARWRILGIPVVPGSTAPLRSADEAIAVARDLGYR